MRIASASTCSASVIGVAAWLLASLPAFAQEPKPRLTLTAHTESVASLAFSPDGKTLASGGKDHAVRLWSTTSGKVVATIKEEDPFLWETVAFSPDGQNLATGGWFNKVKIWDLAALKGKLIHDGREECPPPTVVFSPDSKTLATGGVCQSKLMLWDVGQGKMKATLTLKDLNSRGVMSLAFNSNATTLASVGYPDLLNLWNLTPGKNMVELNVGKSIVCAAFSSDGKSLATGQPNRTIRLWEVATGQGETVLKGHEADLISLAFSRDGKTLASGDEEGTIKLWDLAKAREVASFLGHSEMIQALAFSPDGITLASGSEDRSIRLWEVEKLK